MTIRRAFLLLPALWAALTAVPALAEDLLDIYRLGLQQDPALKAADQQRLAALQDKPQARALLLPNLSANGSVSRNVLELTHGPTTYFTNQNYALQLTQPLYNRAYWVQLSQADSQIAQAQANYVAAEQDLINRVASTYFGVLSAQAGLDYVIANKEATARQLEQARQRFDVGLVAITDVQDAQSRYDQAVASEIVARNDLERANAAVAEITGQEPGKLADLGEKLPLDPPKPANLQKWIDTSLGQNPRVLANQFAVKVARDNVEVQRSGHFPTLDVVGSYGYENLTSGGIFPLQGWDGQIGLQLNVPIYAGGGVLANTRQAAHLYEAAKDNLGVAQRATVRQTTISYRTVLDTISSVKALKQAVASAETALEATQAGYEVGTRTIVDLLNSQTARYLAVRDYKTRRYDYLLAGLALQQAAGQISEVDVAGVNRLLHQPKKAGETRPRESAAGGY